MDNAAAFVEIDVTESLDVESHTLFIDRITACETLDKGKVPMTYSYYREVKSGGTPRTVTSCINIETR
jgi:hypothetical protein